MPAAASQSAIALVALMKLKGVGRRSAIRVIRQASADQTDSVFQSAVVSSAERSKLAASDLVSAWDAAVQDLGESRHVGITAISFFDTAYPDQLRQTPDPPAVVYVKGELAWRHVSNSVAIVGTREPTTYGAAVAKRSAATAAAAGFIVVSGLAHGCDTFAHEGCVSVGGIGVAVLAHGLDRIYPASNRGLADKLLEHRGCLLSEYPLGFKPLRNSFAERDRIQSGLADGVLVIETDVQGGTMHTVRFSREQRRALACIEHPPSLRHELKTKGNQKLIADGWAERVPDGDALAAFLLKLKQSRDPALENQAETSEGGQLPLLL